MNFKKLLLFLLFLNTFVMADGIEESTPTITVQRVSNYEISEKDASTKKAIFRVTLSEAPSVFSGGLSLAYEVQDWSAIGGMDYVANSGGTLYFLPFQTQKEIEVEIIDDKLKGGIDADEAVLEYFNFQLMDDEVEGYTFSNKNDYQVILDDDVIGFKYGYGNVVLEGDENSTSKVEIALELSQAFNHDVVVHYKTIDDSAKAGEDYKYSEGDISFKAGETWKTFEIPVIGDKLKESLYENFYVRLSSNESALSITYDISGTIVDDDIPTFFITTPSEEKFEGNSGQTCIPFTIKLSKPSTQETKVYYSTYDGSAKLEYNDYTQITDAVATFAPNETSKEICVMANGDTKVEANEDVGVWLNWADNAEVTQRSEGDGSSRNVAGMINNDDNATHTSGTCDSSMFISRSLDNKMFISKIDISTNPFKFNMLEEAGSEDIYNALVYSEVDNFMYALNKRELLQIGMSGTVVKMGTVSGLSDIYETKQLFGGATYGGYYFVTGTATPMQQIFKIKLSDKSVQTINLDQAVDLLDISPTPDGKYLYGIDNKKKLTKVEVATGHVEFIGSDHTDVQFDTTYSDVNGKFFANDSGGKGFYEINLATGQKAFRSPSSKATFNDGANCINAPLVFTDFGDAPQSYGEATHNIIGNLTLGTAIDHDISSYFSYDAAGDDVNGSDDEDGVTMEDANKTKVEKASLYPNKPYGFSVEASNNGFLSAWIDYNLNGTFEDTEKIADSIGMVKGANVLNFTTPANLELFKTSFVRFRFSSQAIASPTGTMGDGEVEDYKINFGPAQKPIKAVFNVERSNSNVNGGDFNLYTQISGRDFDVSVIPYEDKAGSNVTQVIDDVTVKVELFDIQNHDELVFSKYVYFPKDNNNSKRIDIIDPSDLALNIASRDMNFKVTSITDSSGYIIRGKYDSDALFNSVSGGVKKLHSAKDDFAIRPELFEVEMEDHGKVMSQSEFRLSAGYEYRLRTRARVHNNHALMAQNYTGTLDSSMLHFNDNNTSCKEHTDVEVKGIEFKHGAGEKAFAHHNSGKYKLQVRDILWTQIDAMNDGCIDSSSVISTNPNEKSGCDVASEEIPMNFYPYKFGLDKVKLQNTNGSTHDEFVYMNSLDSDDTMALGLEGDIEAQNFNGGVTTNFSAGCGSEDINIVVQYNGESDQGEFNNLAKANIVTKNSKTPRNLMRKDTFNTISTINEAHQLITIPKANIKEGISSASMLFNVQRDENDEINPIRFNLEKMIASSLNAYSSTNNVDNYIPSGEGLINAMRMFYYARLMSDKLNYPVTYDGVEDTPLYAEIYCNHTADFCKQMMTLNGLNGSRTQQGWFTSMKHENGVDGQVLEVKEMAKNTSLVSTIGDYNILTKGKTTNLATKYTGSDPMDSKMEITNISPWLKSKNQYWFNHFRQAKEGKWAGVGKTGHTIKIESNGTTSKKLDW